MDAPSGDRAAALFEVLASDLRVDILLALWEREPPVAYSTLQAAVDVPDSGRFNYHLSKLEGPFVRKTDAGYELTPAGRRVKDLLLSGSLTEDVTVAPRPLDVDCPDCGAALQAGYADGKLRVDCPDCPRWVTHFHFPPRAVRSRDLEDVLLAYSNHARSRATLERRGICVYCGGRMGSSLYDCDDAFATLSVRSQCRDCGGRAHARLGLYLLDHPAVAGFLHDHGVAPDDRPYWSFDWCLAGEGVEVVARDPLVGRLTIERDDEEVRVTVDANGSVDEVVRLSRR